MILFGINSKNEYKLFEGSALEASKKHPEYSWLESFNTMREAKTVLNARMLDIPVYVYELLRDHDKDKKSLNDFINLIAESSDPVK